MPPPVAAADHNSALDAQLGSSDHPKLLLGFTDGVAPGRSVIVAVEKGVQA